MKLEEKLSGKIGVRVGNEFTLFISNEDINNIIKILKSLEDSNVLIDGITETVKHEIKKHEGRFLPAMLGHFNSATSDFFSRKRYKWKRS